MDTTAVINILLHGNQLKRTPRTGWVQRGVPNAEDVAAHSFGVVYAILVLAPLVEADINLERALAMAALHDLPESLTTDIPTPAWRFLPDGVKTAVERASMQEMLFSSVTSTGSVTEENNISAQFMDWWEELHASETAEALLVHDADKIDMFLQALMYEKQTGNQHLAEFWTKPYTFNYPESQAIYDALRAQRN
jgi:putative hydrolases of HD superfamily